jgi:hypothetical protein
MQVALNGKQHYKLKAYGHEIIYFILSSTKETQMCYTENGVITTLEFLISTIFVEFGGHIFQQLLWGKKKKQHYLWHVFAYQGYTFAQIILNDTHSSCKFGRL